MNYVAKLIFSLIEKSATELIHDRQAYIYGISQFLYTVFSTILLLCIGGCFKRGWETSIAISTFYLNQSHGGGYHASTRVRCVTTMSIGIMILLILISVGSTTGICIAIFVCGALILCRYPLVLHVNKSFLHNQFPRLRKKSLLIVSFEILLFFVLIIVKHANLICNYSLMTKYMDLIYSYSLAVLFSAISRLAAIKIRKESYSYPHNQQ